MNDAVASHWEGRTAEAWRAAWRIPGLHIFESTTSTNDVAMRLAANGATAGTTVIAERQSRGRGQDGRTWFGQPGTSLLMSVVLHGGPGTVDPSTMPLRTGAAVAAAIEETAGVPTLIKWPNDILADSGRKLGGVLCEGASGAGAAWLVAGIGINVAQDELDFDATVREHAVSIRMLGGRADRPGLVRRILDALRPFRIQPPPLDPATLQSLTARDALRGLTVTVNGRAAGTADGIAPDGALRVARDGTTTTIRSGTVRVSHPGTTSRAAAVHMTGPTDPAAETTGSEAPR